MSNRAGGNESLQSILPLAQPPFHISRNHSASHAVLIKADDTLLFPERGAVISLTRSTEGGATVAAGIVGSEGQAARGVQARVQIAGGIRLRETAAWRSAPRSRR